MSDFDPQEFGRLQAQVEQLLISNRLLTEAISNMNTALQAMQLQMAEAKGGWRMLLAIGGASATFGGTVTGAVMHFFGKGSP
jgi:hypothetical protein